MAPKEGKKRLINGKHRPISGLRKYATRSIFYFRDDDGEIKEAYVHNPETTKKGGFTERETLENFNLLEIELPSARNLKTPKIKRSFAFLLTCQS